MKCRLFVTRLFLFVDVYAQHIRHEMMDIANLASIFCKEDVFGKNGGSMSNPPGPLTLSLFLLYAGITSRKEKEN
jgi:hypothetical protein